MRKVSRSGFTLVELSIAIVFVGLLSVSLAGVISSMMASYRRGNILSQVNTAGTSLIDDFTAATRQSSARSLTRICNSVYADNEAEKEECLVDDAYNFVSLTHFSEVTSGGKIFKAPVYGVYCTGSYSYIWNSGYYELENATFEEKSLNRWAVLISNDYPEGIRYQEGEEVANGNHNVPFKLLKVLDKNRSICVAAFGEKENGYEAINDEATATAAFEGNIIDVREIGNGMLEGEPEYLISSHGATDLAIYDLTVSRPAVNYENNSVFYQAAFILGTLDGGVNILSHNSACEVPSGYDFAYNYCAINKFSFAVRALGE